MTWPCIIPAAPRAAEATADDIRALGVTAVTLQADLVQDDESRALLPMAAEALGKPITTLINNASIFDYDTLETATPESWDRHIGSNLKAPFWLTQALAAQIPDPILDENGEPQAQGLVVNMIDQRVRKLTPEFMTYTLAKMGLWAFTRTSAQALAPKVRVNGIGPGPTMQGARQSAEHFAAQRQATVLQRGADPEGIVGGAALPAIGPLGDGAVDLRRWRSAPGLADPRCLGRGIG